MVRVRHKRAGYGSDLTLCDRRIKPGVMRPVGFSELICFQLMMSIGTRMPLLLLRTLQSVYLLVTITVIFTRIIPSYNEYDEDQQTSASSFIIDYSCLYNKHSIVHEIHYIKYQDIIS